MCQPLGNNGTYLKPSEAILLTIKLLSREEQSYFMSFQVTIFLTLAERKEKRRRTIVQQHSNKLTANKFSCQKEQ